MVLVANLLGALAAALAVAHTGSFGPHALEAFAELGRKALEPGFGTLLVRGVFAGWLIALMVWLLPFAESARVWVIVIITYVVGLGEFSHIVAGSVETFTAAAAGQVAWPTVLGGYVVPTLAGNVICGATPAAMLNHAQVVAGGGEKDL